MGASALYMARYLPKDGVLYAVDTFDILIDEVVEPGVKPNTAQKNNHWN